MRKYFALGLLLFSHTVMAAQTFLSKNCELFIASNLIIDSANNQKLTIKGYRLMYAEDFKNKKKFSNTNIIEWENYPNTNVCYVKLYSGDFNGEYFKSNVEHTNYWNIYNKCDFSRAIMELPICIKTKNLDYIREQPYIAKWKVTYNEVSTRKIRMPASWWRSNYPGFEDKNGKYFYEGQEIVWVGNILNGGWHYIHKNKIVANTIFKSYTKI